MMKNLLLLITTCFLALPMGISSAQSSKTTLSDLDIYKISTRCYRLAWFGVTSLEAGTKERDLELSIGAAWMGAAQFTGKRLGYGAPKIQEDLKNSGDKFVGQINQNWKKYGDSSPEAFKINTALLKQEQDYCNSILSNQQVKEQFMKAINR